MGQRNSSRRKQSTELFPIARLPHREIIEIVYDDVAEIVDEDDQDYYNRGIWRQTFCEHQDEQTIFPLPTPNSNVDDNLPEAVVTSRELWSPYIPYCTFPAETTEKHMSHLSEKCDWSDGDMSTMELESLDAKSVEPSTSHLPIKWQQMVEKCIEPLKARTEFQNSIHVSERGEVATELSYTKDDQCTELSDISDRCHQVVPPAILDSLVSTSNYVQQNTQTFTEANTEHCTKISKLWQRGLTMSHQFSQAHVSQDGLTISPSDGENDDDDDDGQQKDRTKVESLNTPLYTTHSSGHVDCTSSEKIIDLSEDITNRASLNPSVHAKEFENCSVVSRDVGQWVKTLYSLKQQSLRKDTLEEEFYTRSRPSSVQEVMASTSTPPPRDWRQVPWFNSVQDLPAVESSRQGAMSVTADSSICDRGRVARLTLFTLQSPRLRKPSDPINPEYMNWNPSFSADSPEAAVLPECLRLIKHPNYTKSRSRFGSHRTSGSFLGGNTTISDDPGGNQQTHQPVENLEHLHVPSDIPHSDTRLSERDHLQVYNYQFWIRSDGLADRVFRTPGDRRIESIGRLSDSRIRLTKEQRVGPSGFFERLVSIVTPTKASLKKCCSLLDDKFPQFYASTGLLNETGLFHPDSNARITPQSQTNQLTSNAYNSNMIRRSYSLGLRRKHGQRMNSCSDLYLKSIPLQSCHWNRRAFGSISSNR